MKNLIIILAFILSITSYASSTDTTKVKSEISDVTVFFSGAQITRNIEVNLLKGEHLIQIDKLPVAINHQSLQLKGINGCKVISVKHKYDYPTSKKKKKEKEIEDKIKAYEQRIKELKNKSSVFDIEETLLLNNSILHKKDGGSAIADIKEAADFYRLRFNETRQSKLNIYSELEDIKETIQELYTELNELMVEKRKTFSQVFATVDCEKNIKGVLKLSYYLESAGWTPLYDFRVDEISKPLEIIYNANVFQSTGEDWKNVNITLSTNDPSISSTKPEITTWYINRGYPYNRETLQEKSLLTGNCTLKGKVIDAETNEPIPFANVVVFKNNKIVAGASSDFDGYFTIKPLPSGYFDIKVSYIGYNNQQKNSIRFTSNKTTFLDFNLTASSESIDEVMVVAYSIPIVSENTYNNSTFSSEEIYKMPGRSANGVATTVAGVYSEGGGISSIRGARSGGNVTYVDGVEILGSSNLPKSKISTINYISNTLKTTITNLEYKIDIPYTIHSDGEDYGIRIKEVKLPVEYVYYAIPSLDKDAFLIAEVTDWTELNLLSGKTSIYYQGTFTGESYVDAENTNDTLSISLGRDKNIIVERKQDKKIKKKNLFSDKKETIGWDFTIKNNKDVKIKIIVEDQIPISELKSILVKSVELSSAKMEKNGKLIWKFDIEPKKKKEFSFKYFVKYD